MESSNLILLTFFIYHLTLQRSFAVNSKNELVLFCNDWEYTENTICRKEKHNKISNQKIYLISTFACGLVHNFKI